MARPQRLEYNEATQTLRLMPQNYMVADFSRYRWILDPDGSIPLKLLVELTKFFSKHKHKFTKDSWKLIRVNLREALT